MNAIKQTSVTQDMLRMVEDHFQQDDLKKMLRTFVLEKAGEGTLWSAITRCTHHMLGGVSPHIEKSAALIEMIMLLLDIVDDLQDRDNMEKSWMQREQAAVLNAVLAFQAMVFAELDQIGSGLTGEVCRHLARAIDGQHADVTQAVQNEEDYIAMVRQKSGSLMRLACMMGYSLVDGLPRETIDCLDDLAECAGVVAQIDNDVRDLLRYDVKNDLLHKKRTLPILFMLEDSMEEFPAIAQYYEGEMTSEEFLLRKVACMQYIRDCGCIEYAQVIRTLFADRADELLEAIPGVSPWKEQFKKAVLGRS